jgi:hypothetical protein
MLKVAFSLAAIYSAAVVLFLFLATLLDQMLGKASVWEIGSWNMAVRFLLGAFLFLLVNMLGDYLRIFSIENYDQRFLAVLGRTVKFLLTNPLRALSLYYLLSAGLAAAIFVFFSLLKIMNTMPGTGLVVFSTFLIQQVFVIFRSFFRLAYYSCQLNLYHRISEEAASEYQ